jgi:tellurite resistance protein
MEFLNKAKESLNIKNSLSKVTVKISDAAKSGMEKISRSNTEEASEEEIEEKGSQMLKVMDWAFEKASGNIPGLGSSSDMAKKYLDKYGSVHAAIDHLVNWQITSSATTGFVTSFGGLPTMAITLPANIAGVMGIQLRMIGAIAELGGYHEQTEEKKTGMYLCLLGSQAGNALSKAAGSFSVKFSTAALRKLPGSVLTKINKAVGFRLATKFGKTGLINLHKAIPVIGGVIGGSVDALSTYSIAKAAKALFLNDIIDFEKQEQIEIAKIRLVINMALLDGVYSDEESAVLKVLVNGVNLSDKSRAMLCAEIDNPKQSKVDLEIFKDDLMNATTLMSGLTQLAKADGTLHPAEKLYLYTLGHELGFADDALKLLSE